MDKVKNNKKLVKILTVSIIALMLLVAGGLALMQRDAIVSYTYASHNNCCGSCCVVSVNSDCGSNFVAEHDVRDGYTINYIRRMLGQNSLHQYKRVHTYEGGVDTYQVPVDDLLEARVFNAINETNNFMPMNTFTYHRERIRGAGRPLNTSNR